MGAGKGKIPTQQKDSEFVQHIRTIACFGTARTGFVESVLICNPSSNESLYCRDVLGGRSIENRLHGGFFRKLDSLMKGQSRERSEEFAEQLLPPVVR